MILFYLWIFCCCLCLRLGTRVGTKVPLVHEGLVFPSSAGTLTCAKSLETMCDCARATVSERFALADHFFSFGEDD
jgi:hypothetical protein